jgi:hypothetical protein
MHCDWRSYSGTAYELDSGLRPLDVETNLQIVIGARVDGDSRAIFFNTLKILYVFVLRTGYLTASGLNIAFKEIFSSRIPELRYLERLMVRAVAQ